MYLLHVNGWITLTPFMEVNLLIADEVSVFK